MKNLCFRQVHLDFHTSEKIEHIGDNFDPDEFVMTLKNARVNSITCFAKCHHGMIYYDTQFPARHPGLTKDLLREQIKACHSNNIRVPIYVSVGWDEYIANRHPEWLERTSEGKPFGAGPFQAGWKTLCFNTPYVDYVKNQTIEILDHFGEDVDGFFFDIVFQDPCCCNYCISSMIKEGLNPESENDRKNFAKKVLLEFKMIMTKTVRSHNKNCSIFYNAGHIGPDIRRSLDLNTHLELESLPSGGWNYDHFPITVRFVKNLGIKYLGMTGRFHKSWADFGGYKNKAALEYECFNAIANGAACSIGDQLHPNGLINKATYGLIGDIYSQIADKEVWCKNVMPVSEAAIFSPEAIGKSEGRIDPSISGSYRMLMESHLQFDIIDSMSDFERYKIIVLPDKIILDNDLKNKFASYSRNNGKIIASFKSGMNADENNFILENIGVSYVGESEFSPDYVFAREKIDRGLLKTEYVMYDRGLYINIVGKTEVLADIWNSYFNRTYNHFCSHVHTPVEKKSDYPAITENHGIIYFAYPIFTMYQKHGARAYKQMVINCIDYLVRDRLIITNAPTTANIILNYQQANERYVLHILHYIPERRCSEIDTIEDVIPLFNIGFQVRLPAKPARVYLAPSLTNIEYTYHDAYTSFVVPEVYGHQMVVMEMKNG